MTNSEFQNIAQTIPRNPGIYKYYNEGNELLYVGKAKDLRKRVSSYFLKNLSSYKTHELVNRIHHIEFTIVNSEQDAFFLENSLIKNFQPRFNINLKDDKSYPYIVIKNEPFPRVFLTRKHIEDGSEYLGPFTSVHRVRELLGFIRQTIPIRTCALNLTQKNIERKKFKVCLEYHLGNCKGPCEALQNEQDYKEGIQQIKNLLKGNLSPVINHFKNEMKGLAEKMEFEKAELIRKKVDFLKNYQSKSVIANPRLSEMDVFSIVKYEEKAYINYLMVQNGTIVQTKTILTENFLDETEEEILAFAVAQLRSTFNSQAKEIILPFSIAYPENEVVITVPKGGDKKKLLDLSEKNAQYFIGELKNKQRLKLDKKNIDKLDLLKQVQQDLRLSQIPFHIECFDNSNFQGSYPVSAMVCFKNGVPSKKDYRHFNVKTVEGINDFATMKEAVYRRYKRVTEEALPWPDLVIIDGGKGQLNAAAEALHELNATGKTTLAGLAKNIEEIFFTGDHESLKLPYDGESLKFIRSIRDEVHRFGITHHRKRRTKGVFKNELEEVKGIGKETANKLLQEFKSVKNIKEKDVSEISKIIGKTKAAMLLNELKKMGPG
ncbi:MAG TPA: excinuclease ABC subunit UvrC [Chitinophagaceae bacterium]|jgi:excinuclease ABC subunit C|nr:excinuclease ABC subunit UvrC [Chitinophagaceae bacterium]